MNQRKEKIVIAVRDAVFKTAEELSVTRVELLSVIGGLYVQFASAYDVNPKTAIAGIQAAFREMAIQKQPLPNPPLFVNVTVSNYPSVPRASRLEIFQVR